MRSGTTLMGSILNTHSDINVISDIIRWFWAKAYPSYKDLQSVYEFDKMVSELKSDIYNGLSKEKVNLYDHGIIRSELAKNDSISIKDVHRTISKHYAISPSRGKEILAGKSTHVAHIYKDFLLDFDSSYIVHMVRDARDVYFSHKKRLTKINGSTKNRVKSFLNHTKTTLNSFSSRPLFLPSSKNILFREPRYIIDDWVLTNQTAVELSKQFPDRIKIVKYEDLVTNPRAIVESICEELKVDFQESMLEYTQLKDREGNTFKANTSHKDIQQGISNQNINKSKDKLTQEEMAYYIRVADIFAKSMGY